MQNHNPGADGLPDNRLNLQYEEEADEPRVAPALV
jgi:hypothetical protein